MLPAASFGEEEGRMSAEVRNGIAPLPAGDGVPPGWMRFVTDKDLPKGFQQVLVLRRCRVDVSCPGCAEGCEVPVTK